MNFRKTAALLLLLTLTVPVLFAGGSQEDSSGVSAGQQGRSPRVVSLAPNITEVIYALGRGDLLVGRTDYCNYPEQVKDVPSVGSIQEPSVETILELKPDLVIGSTHAPKEAAELLQKAGIEVRYYYGPGSVEGVYRVIEAVGSDLDAESEAEALITGMKTEYEDLRRRAAAIDPGPSVYFVVGFGDGGDWTAGGDTFIGQMIELAGGDNIASDVSGWSFSLEKIVEADPDIIIIGDNFREAFIRSPVYSGLTAVKEGRVYAVNEDMIERQGPRLIKGIAQLNAIFAE